MKTKKNRGYFECAELDCKAKAYYRVTTRPDRMVRHIRRLAHGSRPVWCRKHADLRVQELEASVYLSSFFEGGHH